MASDPTLSTLSLALLQTLDVLLLTKNLSHTAQRLGCSQPVISRQLTRLRRQFDDPLLVRQGRGYVLTPRAEALVEPIKKIITELEALIHHHRFDLTTCKKRFTLASSDYVAEHMLNELMKRLLSMAPGLSVHYSTWHPQQIPLLGSGELDLVTTMLDDVPPELHGKLLGKDHPVCVMRADHPLAATDLHTESYLAWPHIRLSGGGDKDSFIDDWLHQHGKKRDIRLEVPFFSSAIRLVSESSLLVTLPEHIALNSTPYFPIAWKPLPFCQHTYHYWVLWHTRMHHDPAHQWFRNQVYELWKNSRFGIATDNHTPSQSL